MNAAGIDAITALMVSQARRALACHGAGNTIGFKYHAARARLLATLLEQDPTVSSPANN